MCSRGAHAGSKGPGGWWLTVVTRLLVCLLLQRSQGGCEGQLTAVTPCLEAAQAPATAAGAPTEDCQQHEQRGGSPCSGMRRRNSHPPYCTMLLKALCHACVTGPGHPSHQKAARAVVKQGGCTGARGRRMAASRACRPNNSAHGLPDDSSDKRGASTASTGLKTPSHTQSTKPR